MIKITINDKSVGVPEDTTILEAAKSVDVYIPTLCHLNLHNIKNVNTASRCRICMVEVEGRRNLAPACSTLITPDMVIKTDTKRTQSARRAVLELFLSNHDKDCENCYRDGTCELQKLDKEFNTIDDKYHGRKSDFPKDKSSLAFKRNPNRCILCGRCETMCNEFQTVGVYSKINRGFDTKIATAFDKPIVDSICTFCGQCVSVCPTAALREVDNSKEVLEVLKDEDKYVIVQTAPAVRVALGEAFGIKPGTDVTGKMVSVLRSMGFKKVFDTNFAADLTVMEETKEFLNRLENNGPLPILTSCCPAWVRFIEYQFPSLLDIPSTCKSPHEMFGSIAKTYLAEKLGIDPNKMIVVSIMPCIAKKHEMAREELVTNGLKDVDYVLSTRELSKIIKKLDIDFDSLLDEEFDSPMGESTGAASIFGITGGVIEAVVRNANYILNKEMVNVDFKDLRGMEGIKEATVKLGDKELKIAVAHGLSNARKVLEDIRDGKRDYHAIEIMACPSGCIGGGGQPYYLANNPEILKDRAQGIYSIDKNKETRISSLNEDIMTLYSEYLGEVGGEKAHHQLHTTYKKRVVD